MSDSLSIKNYPTTLLLTIFLGFFGAHRFYAGKVFTGLLFLVTFGFLGFGWLIDIITVSVGNFTDKTGRFIRPQPKIPITPSPTPAISVATPSASTPPHASEGIAMTNTPDTPAPTPSSNDQVSGGGEETPKRKVPTWLWVVGGIVVLALLVNAFGGGSGDTSADAPQEAPAAVDEAGGPESAPEPAEEPEDETEPAPVPAAVFEPIVIEGSGDDIIDVPVITDSIIVATFTHQGSSNFAVVSYGQSGDRISLLVNEIGNFQGTVPFNFSEAPAELEITASGPWTVTLSDLLEQPIYDGSLFTGSGAQVLLVSTDSNRLTATHNGRSNFAILGWGDRRSLLINEIGVYEGTVRLGSPLALEIKADGEWTLVSD
jgi:hypothetical protein